MTDVWQSLQHQYALSDEQMQQFHTYYQEMIAWNQYMNLTAITDEHDVVAYHFADALEVCKHYPVARCTGIVDVGTGAGVPGIPLKIALPHLQVVLVEVSQKKVQFLEHVIAKLRLGRMYVSDYDWRTFLRKSHYDADVVTARASLQPDELIRMFKPSSPYNTATCIYWASAEWRPSKKVTPYLNSMHAYTVADRQRQYVCLADASHT